MLRGRGNGKQLSGSIQISLTNYPDMSLPLVNWSGERDLGFHVVVQVATSDQGWLVVSGAPATFHRGACICVALEISWTRTTLTPAQP